jgi:hypothetical protein
MVAIFVQDPIVMPPFQARPSPNSMASRGASYVLLAMVPGLSVKEAAEMLGSARRPKPTCNTFIEDRHFEADRARAFVHELHTAGQRNRLPA